MVMLCPTSKATDVHDRVPKEAEKTELVQNIKSQGKKANGNAPDLNGEK